MSNVILEKSCNAFYPDAKNDIAVGSARLANAISKHIQGGAWVGGKFRAESEWLYFEPGILSITAYNRVDPVRIHASELRNIRRDSGWVMDTVIIDHARDEFKFSCYGADKVVKTLMSYYFPSGY